MTAETNVNVDDLVVENDTGARHPSGITKKVIALTALLWSLFQIWIASPIAYFEFITHDLGIPVLNSTQSRAIHLAFALFLVFLAYPAFNSSPRNRVPIIDWLFAFAGAVSSGYIFLFYHDLAMRPGMPLQQDLIMACVGMVTLLEATRRSLGWPLVILAVLFLSYTFFGQEMPDLISHKGQSFNKVAGHQWLSTEGVFGIALDVSTSFVFLFVLFGALLDKAGAGNYFIKSAFALLGHLRGGPAKAAVLASGFTGLISGSSIANVVTTGTFTVPLMKRVGFTAEKAGAVEVAGSVNGQIMPPVMGAAAFLMIEYVGIPYIEVIKHSFIPAVISYIALLYIVHLEAVKADTQVLQKPGTTLSFKQRMLVYGINISAIIIFSGLCYVALTGIREFMGESAVFGILALILVIYVYLSWQTTRYPVLEVDDPNSEVVTLPELRPTLMAGLHYLLPLVVLIWSLMVERLSPGLSAFYATMMMVFILMTQKPLIAFFRKTAGYAEAFREGVDDLYDGLIQGARNMIGIAIATAAAGIIVGTVTLTGVANIMPTIVDALAGDSLILVLILTAVICLILGMGLPTTANYIVVSSIMVGVIEQLGAKHGLIVPLIAIHLFVFYFGIMADVTPPVGLASFAAAAVSGGDPIKTGLQAFWYSIRTAILPFIFIFNHDILLIGVETFWEGALVFLYATVAILLLTAVLQGYFIIKSKWYETALLLLVSVSLFRPGMWMDMIYPPYRYVEPALFEELAQSLPDDIEVKVKIVGEELEGPIEFYTMLPLGKQTKDGSSRLQEQGLTVEPKGELLVVKSTGFMSPAESAGFYMDNEIHEVGIPQTQPDKRWVFIPAFLLLFVVIAMQKMRERRMPSRNAIPAPAV